MAEESAYAAGLQIVDVVESVSANKGQDVALRLRVSNGEKEQELVFFCAHDLIQFLVLELTNGAAMAYRTRQKEGAGAPTPGDIAHGLNLPVEQIEAGTKMDKSGAVLTVRNAGGMEFRLLVDKGLVRQLAGMLPALAAELETEGLPDKVKRKIN